MVGYIYMTINKINGKKYIGRRCGNSEEPYLGSGSAFKRAVKKYKKENFTKIILEDNITDIEELYKKEIFYIKKYNAVKSRDFYNISPGGEDKVNNLDKKFLERVAKRRVGRKASQDTIKKLKESHKNQSNSNLRKGVIQYDLEWNYIKEFESLSEATREMGFAVGNSSMLTQSCRFKIPVWGYYWRYKDENFTKSELSEQKDTSKFRGVSFLRKKNKYTANINYKYKKYYLGLFNTPEEAHEAYCKKAKELLGKNAKTIPNKYPKPKPVKKK